jgi:hypothetical protein
MRDGPEGRFCSGESVCGVWRWHCAYPVAGSGFERRQESEPFPLDSGVAQALAGFAANASAQIAPQRLSNGEYHNRGGLSA